MTTSEHPYDLIVVGCGAAGLSAALGYIEKARQLGNQARVAVLESAPLEERGGATRWTTARFRAKQNYSLDPLFVGKMQEVSQGLADLDYCRALEAEAPNSLRFLEQHGIGLIHQDAQIAKGMDHAVMPNGGGRAIVDALASALGEVKGAEILYRMEAIRLTLSETGRLDGVVARGPNGLLRALRGRSLMLACGGFEGNTEMLTRYVGGNACDLKLLAPGLAYNQGAGIRMAMDVGAAMSGQFDMMHAELVDRRTDRADAVILGHPFGIVVNGDGKRFFDEGQAPYDDNFEQIAYEVWRNQRQVAFFIADQTITKYPGVMVLFDTDKQPIEAPGIPELARLLGLEPEQLLQTVNAYNAAVGPGDFDPSRIDGKSTSGLVPEKSNWAYRLERPPFFAYPVTTAICFTYGGIRTDAAARVLSGNGTPIPGLYAAGEITGFFYHEYPVGTSVLRSLTFGRIAGAHAAEAAHASL